MACGVILLQQTDISLIYYMIRGQGTIKLYVVYNVLETEDEPEMCARKYILYKY
ncbi:putative Tapt1 family protein [Rosa chinensis]|uniref:Putative Tapt1 family protein n=1 Tax=Rosa chinensis TaxID=74649 RepID=A0A2P6PV73_ROSCH|nr:putative Tapt1 family protein [Rosa chinensis]